MFRPPALRERRFLCAVPPCGGRVAVCFSSRSSRSRAREGEAGLPERQSRPGTPDPARGNVTEAGKIPAVPPHKPGRYGRSAGQPGKKDTGTRRASRKDTGKPDGAGHNQSFFSPFSPEVSAGAAVSAWRRRYSSIAFCLIISSSSAVITFLPEFRTRRTARIKTTS